MTHDEVAARVGELVSAHLDIDAARLHPDARLGDDLCIDSLGAIELAMILEDDFRISVPDAERGEARTYGDVIALVEARLMANGDAPALG